MAKKIPAWETPFLVRKRAAPTYKPPKNAPGVTDLSSAVAWSKNHGNPTAGPYTAPNSDIGDPQVPISSLPAAPAAAPPPPGDPGWQDSTYNTAVGNLRTNLANFGASLTGQGTALSQDYGINAPAFNPDTYDPNNPGKFTIDDNVDVTNPFSKAALLKKSFQAQSRGDTNRYAGSGQLYAGSLQNAQNTDNRNFLGGQNSLLTDFGSRYGGLYGSWLNAKGTEQTGEGDAGTAALSRWAAAGYPGAAPAAGAAPATTPPATTPPAATTAATPTPVGIGGGPQKTTTTKAAKKPVQKGKLVLVKPKGKK